MVWVRIGFRIMVRGIIGVRVLQLGVSVSVRVSIMVRVRFWGGLGLIFVLGKQSISSILALGHVP